MSTDKTEEALPPLPEPTVYTHALEVNWALKNVGRAGSFYATPENPNDLKLFTADQMRGYARAALAQRQQVPEGWTMRLDADAAETLKQTIGDDDTVSEITLSLCDGHEGRGLYVWLTEYPEEGSLLLAAAPALTAAPPAQQQTCFRSHPHEDMSPECEALTIKARADNAAAQQQSAQPEQQPVAKRVPLLDFDALCTAFCAKWSGSSKVEAGDVLEWIMGQPLYATQPRAVEPLTDEQIDKIEDDCRIEWQQRHPPHGGGAYSREALRIFARSLLNAARGIGKQEQQP